MLTTVSSQLHRDFVTNNSHLQVVKTQKCYSDINTLTEKSVVVGVVTRYVYFSQNEVHA